MARWVLLFLVIIGGVISCPGAQAAGFTQCNGGVTATTANCPILGKDPVTGSTTKEFTLPKPIGKVILPARVEFFSGPLCIVDNSIRSTMEGLYAVFSDAFIKPFKVVLMLYVCVYAISFMFGLVNPRDFALRLFKFPIIVRFIIISMAGLFLPQTISSRS